MTYRELQQTLKSYRDQGYHVPALNSKKEVLESALEQIESGIIESGEIEIEAVSTVEKKDWQEMLNDDRTIEALGRIMDFVSEMAEFYQPVERVWKLQKMSLTKLRRYARKQGVKHPEKLRKAQLVNILTA